MFEDREPIWPQGKKKKPEPYPWRVEAEPVIVLDEERFVPAEELVDELEHVAQVAARSTGTSPSRASCGRSATPTPSCCESGCAQAAAAAAGVTDEGPSSIHERHFTRAEANAPLPQPDARCCSQLRDAKDELTDAEAHEALSDAAPANGGGEQGRQVGVAFLEVRRLLERPEESGIVLRDIDRGLVDFPAMVDGREVYLCWELGEDEVAYWHDLDVGLSVAASRSTETPSLREAARVLRRLGGRTSASRSPARR